jgi:predicted transcriptional regulator
MTSLTVTLPDDTYRRLDQIAQERGQSIDALFDAMAGHLVADADAEARFRTRAQRGQGQHTRGLALLDKARGDGVSH